MVYIGRVQGGVELEMLLKKSKQKDGGKGHETRLVKEGGCIYLAP